ncbi:MAG: PAS domain S-box protein, partial [Bacteroidota bacterium]|nr:PAS domain S-box protein [Bacteroidota bacterium]
DNQFLQQQVQAIYDNSSDGIFLVDGDKKIIKANKRAVELFGLTSEENMIGRYGRDFHKAPMSNDELHNLSLTLLNKGYFESEFLYKSGSSDEFWGSIFIKIITISDRNYQMVRITDVSDQHRVNAKLKASLQEKELLLAEIHHRVKNNLAVISGLLGLQSSYIEDEKAKELFEESRDRIHTMALIHDKLYQHETFAKIDFHAYISDLVAYIKHSYSPAGTKIEFFVTCNDIFLDIKNAVPCGLILNELISNSCKHAFGNTNHGEIRIICTK